MRKTRKAALLLLFAALLLLLGGFLLLGTIFAAPASDLFQKEIEGDFREIQVSLHDCAFSVKKSDRTYLEAKGYHESELGVLLSDRTLVISDEVDFTEKLMLGGAPGGFSGIGRYLRECRSLSKTREVTLYLSDDSLSEAHSVKKDISLTLRNGSLSLEGNFSNISLSANGVSVLCDRFSFQRFEGDLTNSDADFFFLLRENAFSRSIETYHTKLDLGKEEEINSDFYFAGSEAPYFLLSAVGGRCRLVYAEKE